MWFGTKCKNNFETRMERSCVTFLKSNSLLLLQWSQNFSPSSNIHKFSSPCVGAFNEHSRELTFAAAFSHFPSLLCFAIMKPLPYLRVGIVAGGRQGRTRPQTANKHGKRRMTRDFPRKRKSPHVSWMKSKGSVVTRRIAFAAASDWMFILLLALRRPLGCQELFLCRKSKARKYLLYREQLNRTFPIWLIN